MYTLFTHEPPGVLGFADADVVGNAEELAGGEGGEEEGGRKMREADEARLSHTQRRHKHKHKHKHDGCPCSNQLNTP